MEYLQNMSLLNINSVSKFCIIIIIGLPNVSRVKRGSIQSLLKHSLLLSKPPGIDLKFWPLQKLVKGLASLRTDLRFTALNKLAKHQNCHFWELRKEIKRTEKNSKELKLLPWSFLRHIKKRTLKVFRCYWFSLVFFILSQTWLFGLVL